MAHLAPFTPPPQLGALLHALACTSAPSSQLGTLGWVHPEVHDAVGTRLRGKGQRYTGARKILVELLESAGRPLSIPEILEKEPALPQSTVYRNLAVLASAGVVRNVASGDDFTRYELDEELTVHHHHLVCTSCGSVSDYTMPRRMEASVTRAIAEIAADTGFRVQSHRLDVIGHCASCSSI